MLAEDLAQMLLLRIKQIIDHLFLAFARHLKIQKLARKAI